MIVRTGIKCRSCKMPVVLPPRIDIPAPPFCGCRFYRRSVKNAVIETPQMRVRVEIPLWLIDDHDDGVALVGEGWEIVKRRSGGVILNGEPIRGAKLILPPT